MSYKKTYLHKKFYKNIKNSARNQIFKSVIVSISGGQDSLCLIKLLQEFQKFHKPLLNIIYIYIDHQWKKDSKSQINHLINFMETINEKIYIYQMNNIVSCETNARKLRYELLINHSLSSKSFIIITAHTETDQTETFFNQIIRGTTIDGATSLIQNRVLENNIQLWRPLINFTRTDISWFCRQYYLPIWSDSSNYSYYIYRNRIRNELIPYLKQYFQQNIEKQISKFLEASRIDNEYIKQNAIKLYLICRHKKSIALNYRLIEKQHISLQIRTLQIFFYHNINRPLDTHSLNKIINELNNKDKAIIQLNNINIRIYNHWIYIY